jgi:hypothetical protein
VLFVMFTRSVCWFEDQGRDPGSVYVNENGREERPKVSDNPGGHYRQDMQKIATWYFHGERPDFPTDFPPKLRMLIEATWAPKQEDRLQFSDVERLLSDPKVGWLDPPEEAMSFEDFLTRVGLEDKQQDLAEYLTGEHKLLELCQMDDDDLTEDILEECLQLDEAARNRFRQAVVAITAAQRLQAGGISAADVSGRQHAHADTAKARLLTY